MRYTEKLDNLFAKYGIDEGKLLHMGFRELAKFVRTIDDDWGSSYMDWMVLGGEKNYLHKRENKPYATMDLADDNPLKDYDIVNPACIIRDDNMYINPLHLFDLQELEDFYVKLRQLDDEGI